MAGTSLTQEQERAVALTFAPDPLVILTGGPGTGKSYVVREIVLAHESLRHRVALAAPTGKAARRLSESTSREAKTLHRLLEFLPEDPHSIEEGTLLTTLFSFRRGRQAPLEFDLVVVDEASMIDVRLMRVLLRACDRERTKLVLVGDADQLPPVGPGAPFQDLVASEVVPIVRLEKIHRQAEGSFIVQNAHKILRGEKDFHKNIGPDFRFIHCRKPKDVTEQILSLVSKTLPEELGLNPFADIQILTPQNTGPLGTEALSLALQTVLNPNQKPGNGAKTAVGELYPLDRVIQIRNDYTRDVMNGEWGQVVSLDKEALRVDLGDREIVYPRNDLFDLALAYAMTVHRAQGSEYRVVIVVLSSLHAYMLSRTLLYTAITRGQELVILVGDERAIQRAVANTTSNQRRTLLPSLLQKET